MRLVYVRNYAKYQDFIQLFINLSTNSVQYITLNLCLFYVCYVILMSNLRYGDSVDNTFENSSVFSLIQMHCLVVAVSKGMWAVKLCTNKILQFLTGDASWCRLTCVMAVKRWFLVVDLYVWITNEYVLFPQILSTGDVCLSHQDWLYGLLLLPVLLSVHGSY